MPVESKNFIVTGGTRGIGRAVVEKIASENPRAKIFALYGRQRGPAEELKEFALAKNWSVETIRGDLTKEDKVSGILDDIFSQISCVHGFVHAAASGVHKPFEDLSLKAMRWTMEVNVWSFYRLLKAIVPKMPAGGRIVALTSSGGQRTIPFYTSVGTSKGALESMCRHLSVELAPKNISLNLVSPGLVLTDAVEAFPDKDARIQKCRDLTPTGEMTTAENVADFVNYLLQNQVAAQIIGQTFTLDGGKTLGA